ncbi:DUF1707 SHOCT-like domain-containing protein [Nocardia aurantia]|uniref:DUF1707 domain-containing protein n=1 Tax=Nocardia aurantia TaxID=2585199 RepID=A0A7K0DSW4_9NOCA|nr:DUF1707 domain-containing protein [Nocardia aurantia]MQY28617.1 hypothetical protein [Nocardia aurantia]
MLDQAPLRATDIAYACTLLNRAYADGQLDGVEHRERVTAAMSAETVGELRSLTADLRPPRAGSVAGQSDSRPSSGRTSHSRRAIVIAAVFGIGAAAGYAYGLATREPRETVSANTTPGTGRTAATPTTIAAPRALHTAAGFSAFVAAVSRTFGDTVVDDASVYPDYAVVTRGVPGEPAHALHFSYRGTFDKGSPMSRQPGTGVVDLARVDVAKLMDLLATAPQTVGVPQPKTTYFSVDGYDGGRSVIYETDAYNVSGYLIAGLDGTVSSVHPAPH